MTFVLAIVAAAAAFASSAAAKTPAAAMPHVVCAVYAVLIVGPAAHPVAVLDQRFVTLVPCPHRGKQPPAA